MVFVKTTMGGPHKWFDQQMCGAKVGNQFVEIAVGNLNAIAMDPLKHMAGIGAAIIGSLSNFIASFLGAAVARCYDGSMLPLASGFVLCGLLTAISMRWADRPRKGRGSG